MAKIKNCTAGKNYLKSKNNNKIHQIQDTETRIKKSKKKSKSKIPHDIDNAAAISTTAAAKNPKKPKRLRSKNHHDHDHEHDKYIIVPWESQVQWDQVSKFFNQNEWTNVLRWISIWKNRVPSLPVGVESTLILVQALLYDTVTVEKSETFNEDHGKSLYSLAVIRFLNHISQLASKEMGGSSLSMSKLAQTLSVPDWIVNLRHEVSHGTSLPSLETLRLAAEFIKNWLKKNYWILPNQTPGNSNILTNNTDQAAAAEELTIYNLISDLVSAYLACRVYAVRHSIWVSDSEITKFCTITNTSRKLKVKEASLQLKRKIVNFLVTEPHLTVGAIVESMMPDPDFYNEFSSLFTSSTSTTGTDVPNSNSIDQFEQFFLLWTPLLNLIVKKNKKKKLGLIISQMAQVHIVPEASSYFQQISAQWINKLLDLVEPTQGKNITNKVLPILVKTPTRFTGIFLKRLMDITEAVLGLSTRQKLESLVSVWNFNVNEGFPNKSGVNGTIAGQVNTLEQIMSLKMNREIKQLGTQRTDSDPNIVNQYHNHSGSELRNWTTDIRDPHFYWKNIPLGSFINQEENEYNNIDIVVDMEMENA